MDENIEFSDRLIHQKLHVLLVEDNHADAELIRDTLDDSQDISCMITHVSYLSHAENFLRTSAQPDIVLLDLNLPDAHGLENVQRVRAVAPDLPVVIMTGLEDKDFSLKLLKEGVQDYLVKGTMSAEELMRSMRYAIERQEMVSQLKKAREIEKYLAYNDVLTQLPNRDGFLLNLKSAMQTGKARQGIVGILFIDLDGFKRINDTLGHHVGDRLLTITAERIKNSIRRTDVAARLGGDEFTVILNDLKDKNQARRVAKKILKSISHPIAIEAQQLFVTASIGISLYPYDGEDVNSLLRNADFAMYRAKNLGKNSVESYVPSEDNLLRSEAFELENALHAAIAGEEFVVYFQPLIHAASGTLSSTEALIRWRHPQKGLILPDRFIPIAERAGLIIPLGNWVIRNVCRKLRELLDEGFPPMRIAINLSNQQFLDRRLVGTITEALAAFDLEPSCLGLEITESSVMQDIDHTIRTLKELRDLGIEIAIDDFGTGFSSLNALKKLPLDILKIDKSFIDGVSESAEDASIVSSIIALARNLGLKAVAEGVETAKQFSYLKSEKCDIIQGYYISRPIGFNALKKFLPDFSYA